MKWLLTTVLTTVLTALLLVLAGQSHAHETCLWKHADGNTISYGEYEERCLGVMLWYQDPDHTTCRGVIFVEDLIHRTPVTDQCTCESFIRLWREYNDKCDEDHD